MSFIDKAEAQQPMKSLIYISETATHVSTCLASLIYPHIGREKASHIGFLSQTR